MKDLFSKKGALLLIIMILASSAFLIISISIKYSATYEISFSSIAQFGIGIGILTLLVSFYSIFKKEVNNQVFDMNTSTEEMFKSFFEEGMFEKFKDRAIKYKLIDYQLKWLYKKEEHVYVVLLFNKLNENSYFKNPIQKNVFCNVSNQIFQTNINVTMYTKYKMDKLDVQLKKYCDNEYSIFNV